MKQCPSCHWIKDATCTDWHYAFDQELCAMAEPEICDFCAVMGNESGAALKIAQAKADEKGEA